MQTELAPVAVPDAWQTVLAGLERHGVEYVIAASAAETIVAGEPEGPLSIAPAPYRRNLERLTAALTELGAALHGADGRPHPFDITRMINHPAVHWNLVAGGAELYVLGSAVGDGEFGIRLWRTRRLVLETGSRRVRADVEITGRIPVAAG
jgi:hypothetical protein